MRLAIFACLMGLAGCSRPAQDLEAELSKYRPGSDYAVMDREMKLASYPRLQVSMNLPPGDDHNILLLPAGNLHVLTRMDGSGRTVLSGEPYFVADSSSVEERQKRVQFSWDEYVKRKTGR